MNAIKQFLLTLLITIFITPTLHAQPCIGDNCLASIGNSKSISNKASFAVLPQENEMIKEENMELDMIPLDDNMGMIELTDNTVYYDNQIDNANLDDSIEFYTNPNEEIEYISEELIDSDIILVDETMENIDNSILVATSDITYACDFIGANTLLCDELTKECQCV